MPDIDPKTHPGTAGAYAKQEECAPHVVLSTAAAQLAEAYLKNDTAAILAAKEAFRKAERGDTQGVALWDIDQLLAFEPAPSDEILAGGMLYAGEPAALIGAPGIGKSRVNLQIAVDVILGREVFGMKSNAPGKKWLILQTENSARRLKYDLERMLRGLKPSEMDMLRHCLMVMNVEADECGTIYMVGDDRRRIEDTIAKVEPDIVCVDPLSDSTTGDLNSDVDMSAAAQAIKQVVRAGNPKRLPLIVHHARPGNLEAAKVFGDESANFARNSKRLLGAIRSQINLAPAGEAHPGIVIFGCGKISNNAKWPPFAAIIDESTMTYRRLDDSDFDLESWAEEKESGKRASKAPEHVSPERVAEIVKESGGRVEGGVNAVDGLVQLVKRKCRLPNRESAVEAVESALGRTIVRLDAQRSGDAGRGSKGGKPTAVYVLHAS